MSSKTTMFDRNMSAVTFAEAGEFDTATEFLKKGPAAAGAEAPDPHTTKKKPYWGMVFFGALSLSGYLLLMKNQGWVNETFTMGGWHAAYPVVTALIFSFVHGAFASNLLTVMGIEAKKK